MSSIRTMTRRAALAAVAAGAAFALAACGGDADDGAGHGGHATASASTGATAPAEGGTATAAHNAQDVAFARGMIPHHRQALDMARLAAGRAASSEVEELAGRIEKAQEPEIATMTGWLESWGEQVPGAADSASGSGHSSHSDHSGMPGMMDGADMERLEKATGEDFDRMFLTLMIEHHEGAVEMAATQQEKGAYQPARALAGDIVTAQKAEIAEMERLLGGR
ncbi:copper resistance protein [Streptomyces cyaneogriseus subsp. noncyanogenus]|uniref:Copper resistance protein n=1 Tax=Streptomyces cyaneogriseus subsp. noncyanogenus TaxID=477245 RepID=A0A0C5GC74_9ACTN|nr:DUF305 domain-containing protein [Streptomyces cyaneogriseus]AJP01821.1 copper resistance protein [Streptomyces cyaneogriseus subsp. noncyanogenus]